MAAGYLSGGTTVLSNVSLAGTLHGSAVSLLAGASLNTVTAASTLSVGGAVTLDSTLTVGGALTATTSVRVGGGTILTRAVKGTISIVTMTVTASRSVTTTATVAGVTTADIVLINPPVASGLSEGVNIFAYASAADTVTIYFSNTSTANAVQAGPVNYPYVAIRS